MGPASRLGVTLPWTVSARLLSYRRVLIVGVHLVLIPLAYLGAFGARFDFQIPPAELRTVARTLPYLLVIRLLIFAWYGLFRGYWRSSISAASPAPMRKVRARRRR